MRSTTAMPWSQATTRRSTPIRKAGGVCSSVRNIVSDRPPRPMSRRLLFGLALALVGAGASAEEYQRIATLAPHLAELVHAAGAGHKLVGVSAYSDYPPAVARL